jgi:maleylacetoacetate isomerase
VSRITLYDYPRSSACYRVRIALNLKHLEYRSLRIDLLEGQQREQAFRSRNPQGFIPWVEIDGRGYGQSLAIVDRLDAGWPKPLLIPEEAEARARVLALALIVACDIHPLNNLRVLKYLGGTLGQDEEARNAWYRHWVSEGLAALEQLAAARAGRFLEGDSPTLADICLVPQLFNARRFEVPLADYPTLVRIDAEANEIDAFAAAHPDRVS